LTQVTDPAQVTASTALENSIKHTVAHQLNDAPEMLCDQRLKNLSTALLKRSQPASRPRQPASNRPGLHSL